MSGYDETSVLKAAIWFSSKEKKSQKPPSLLLLAAITVVGQIFCKPDPSHNVSLSYSSWYRNKIKVKFSDKRWIHDIEFLRRKLSGIIPVTILKLLCQCRHKIHLPLLVCRQIARSLGVNTCPINVNTRYFRMFSYLNYSDREYEITLQFCLNSFGEFEFCSDVHEDTGDHIGFICCGEGWNLYLCPMVVSKEQRDIYIANADRVRHLT